MVVELNHLFARLLNKDKISRIRLKEETQLLSIALSRRNTIKQKCLSKTLTEKFSFLQGIKCGIQYTITQSETVQILVFWERHVMSKNI